jgi:DNA-binding NarL/FixJ family response regulator
MEQLRAKSPLRGIAFSAFDEPEHVARSKAAGFDEHVVKGTTPEALLAAIDRVASFRLPVDGAAATATDNVATRNGATKKRRAARPRKASTTTSRA